MSEVLKRYKGREHTLFEHLRRKYNVSAKIKIKSNMNFHKIYQIFCHALFSAENGIQKQTDISGSFILTRNYRNRSDFQIEAMMKEWYFGFVEGYDSAMIKTQQILDKIYCFFMHSYDTGLVLKRRKYNQCHEAI